MKLSKRALFLTLMFGLSIWLAPTLIIFVYIIVLLQRIGQFEITAVKVFGTLLYSLYLFFSLFYLSICFMGLPQTDNPYTFTD